MRICAFGDSGVLGHLDPEQLGWAGRLQRLESAAGRATTVYNLGVRGDSSREVRRRWRREAEARFVKHDRSALIFSFGVNDATTVRGADRVTRQDTVENFRAIAREATQVAPALFIGSFPVGEQSQPAQLLGAQMEVRNAWIEEVDAALKKAAEQENAPYLSLFSQLIDDPLWRAEVATADGVHLAPSGHLRIAELVSQWKPWLALMSPG